MTKVLVPLAIGLLNLGIPSAASSQSESVGENEPVSLLLQDDQFLFADDTGDETTFGLGEEKIGDERIVQILKLPGAWTIRSHEEHAWGVRMRLPFSVGIDKVTFDDIVDDEPLGLELLAWSIIPAVELTHQLSETWLMRPYAELGVGRETSGVTEWFVIAGAGIGFDRQKSWGPREWLWESKLKYGVDLSGSGERDDSYTSIQTGAGLHLPTGLVWRDARWTFGSYGSVRYYINELALPLPGQDEFAVDWLYEVGVTFGAFEKAKLLGVPIPRLRVGYRWGDGVRGVKIRLGGSF